MFTTTSRTRQAAFFSGVAVGSPATHLSLHSALPDSNGSNELTGGSPAYARKAVTWGTAVNGVLPQTGSVVFDVPAGSVVAVGFWSAVSSGTFLGYAPTNGGSLFGFSIGRAGDSILSPAHGLLTGDRIEMASPVVGGNLPSGYAASTLYAVTKIDADTFTVAPVSTGITTVPTTSAALVWQRIVSDTFAVQGTLTVSGLQLVFGA